MTDATYANTPNRTVDVGGTRFAYRELGPTSGVPVIFLNHLAAVLDNWDPRVVDGIAAKRRVIVFDNRGIGASRSNGCPQPPFGSKDKIVVEYALRHLKEPERLRR